MLRRSLPIIHDRQCRSLARQLLSKLPRTRTCTIKPRPSSRRSIRHQGALAYAGAFAIWAKSCRQPSPPPPAVRFGEFRSFGPLGRKYEGGRAIRQLGDGDWMIEITMIETGEKAEYRWSHLIDDPQAH